MPDTISAAVLTESDTGGAASRGWRLDLADAPETGAIRGSQGQAFTPVATDTICGARDLSVYRVNLPLERHIAAHYHNEDRLILVRSGHAATLMASPLGGDWELAVVTGPGDVLFIPAGWRHQAVGLEGNSVQAVEISGDARFNHSVILVPELERPELESRLRAEYANGELAPGAYRLDERTELRPDPAASLVL